MTIQTMFFDFFKIALFTLGGGYAILPVMHNHFVKKKKLISENEFQEFLSVVQGLPGSLAANCATLIGYKLYGVFGSIIAVLGSIMPSFITITLISIFFSQISSVTVVAKFFLGIRPAVVALILYFGIGMMRKTRWNIIKGIMLVFFLCMFIFLNINPIMMILLGIFSGLLYTAWIIRKGKA